jgi:hypothetical protein
MAFKEEVKAFETAGGAGFDFDGYDMGFHRQEKIDFGLAIEGFANPEGEFGFLIGRGGGEEFLSDKLLGGGTTVDAQKVGLGDEFGVDSEGGVEKTDVEKNEFDEARIGLSGKREALT